MASVFKNLKKKGNQDKNGKTVFEEDVESSESDSDSQQSEQGVKQSEQPTQPESKSDKSSEKEEQEEEQQVDSEDELRAFKDPEPASKEWKNRQRTLVAYSRGVSGRFKYLINDILDMIPNTKKESKLDRKQAKEVIDELCFELSCNNFLFFEQHKKQDLFLWMSKSPCGPALKFLVSNIHTS